MLTERRILDASTASAEGAHIPELRRLDGLTWELTSAFLLDDPLTFGQAVERVIDEIQTLQSSSHEASHDRDVDAFILHLIPDDLFDQFHDVRETDEYIVYPATKMMDMVKIVRKADKYETTFSQDELRALMRHVREKIAERLQQRQLDDVYVVDRSFADGKAETLHGGKVFKRGLTAKDAPLDYFKPSYDAAIKRLYALPERSPYLSYPDIAVDARGNAYVDRQIRSVIDFVTLEQFAMKENLPPFRSSLSAVRDVIKGVIFLWEHGLSITDLDPENIAIRPDGTGMLFDYGTLATREEGGMYLAKRGFHPPDVSRRFSRRSFERKPSDAAFELGTTLHALVQRYYFHERVSTTIFDRVRGLSYKLTDDDPERRLSLEDAVTRLDKIIDEIQREESHAPSKEAGALPADARVTPSLAPSPFASGGVKKSPAGESAERQAA